MSQLDQEINHRIDTPDPDKTKDLHPTTPALICII